MTDQTKCPHCGADGAAAFTNTIYRCGTRKWADHLHQSQICEISELQQKVAAQQELLREAATSLRDALAFIESSESRKELWLCCHDNESVQEVLRKLDAKS